MRKYTSDIARATTIYADFLVMRSLHPYRANKYLKRPSNASENYFGRSKIYFVHIPKTGGTSIQSLFRSLDDQIENSGVDRVSNISHLSKHAKAHEIISVIGKHQWDQLFTFAIVRNPWDLVVSSYNWWQQIAFESRKGMYETCMIRRMSFDEFVESKYGRYFINEHIGSIQDWYEYNGNRIVSYVVKLGEINIAVGEILDRLDLGKPCQSLSVPTLNKSGRSEYQDYYTDRKKDMIFRRLEKVIHDFDYEF